MQGYILNINRVKNEDLIVSILTKDRLKTLYRFYGARHSVINIGYKIDFEAIYSAKSSIPMLREVLPLSYKWIFENNRFYVWQQFLKLLYKHLKDVEELNSFYFDMLDNSAAKLHKQNPKRVMIESYLSILSHEGRLHNEFVCFLCDEGIDTKSLKLTRSLMPTHLECANGFIFDKRKIQNLFDTKSTIELNNDEIESLWDIVCRGL